MPDRSAAERAANVLTGDRPVAPELVGKEPFLTDLQAEYAVAALMADPALLVDLAIEAGWLVPDEWFKNLYRRRWEAPDA